MMGMHLHLQSWALLAFLLLVCNCCCCCKASFLYNPPFFLLCLHLLFVLFLDCLFSLHHQLVSSLVMIPLQWQVDLEPFLVMVFYLKMFWIQFWILIIRHFLCSIPNLQLKYNLLFSFFKALSCHQFVFHVYFQVL